MSKPIKTDNSYKAWITELKQRIRLSQIKAAVKVNIEMLHLYWSIGEDIVNRSAEAVWGKSVINQLLQDLKDEFPHMEGFSPRNLAYMKQMYLLYNCGENLQQLAAKVDDVPDVIDDAVFSIPWGHQMYILDKIKDVKEALFYVHKIIEDGWSRNMLLNMPDTRLYEEQGKAITNFDRLLPAPQSDLAQQILKDPYNFDLLTMREGYVVL